MYNKSEMKKMLNFDGYNIIASLNIMYKYTIKYLNLLFFSYHDRLLVTNPILKSKHTIK